MDRGFTAKAQVRIAAPPIRVWDALVNPDMIREYLFGTEVKSDWTVGSSITYRGTWNGTEYEDKGTILELVPEKRFVSTYWSSMSGAPDLPENYSTVTWEMQESDGGTTLTVAQDNNATRESADHSTENWRTVLAKIKELLER